MWPQQQLHLWHGQLQQQEHQPSYHQSNKQSRLPPSMHSKGPAVQTPPAHGSQGQQPTDSIRQVTKQQPREWCLHINTIIRQCPWFSAHHADLLQAIFIKDSLAASGDKAIRCLITRDGLYLKNPQQLYTYLFGTAPASPTPSSTVYPMGSCQLQQLSNDHRRTSNSISSTRTLQHLGGSCRPSQDDDTSAPTPHKRTLDKPRPSLKKALDDSKHGANAVRFSQHAVHCPAVDVNYAGADLPIAHSSADDRVQFRITQEQPQLDTAKPWVEPCIQTHEKTSGSTPATATAPHPQHHRSPRQECWLFTADDAPRAAAAADAALQGLMTKERADPKCSLASTAVDPEPGQLGSSCAAAASVPKSTEAVPDRPVLVGPNFCSSAPRWRLEADNAALQVEANKLRAEVEKLTAQDAHQFLQLIVKDVNIDELRQQVAKQEDRIAQQQAEVVEQQALLLYQQRLLCQQRLLTKYQRQLAELDSGHSAQQHKQNEQQPEAVVDHEDDSWSQGWDEAEAAAHHQWPSATDSEQDLLAFLPSLPASPE